mmetsp:Transcript_37714/g.96384  ORF Transcript_37714/g.96384 Transcript_37714/m.96384 type:complete len:225 (+) Transcript_37714:534-1208(+)
MRSLRGRGSTRAARGACRTSTTSTRRATLTRARWPCLRASATGRSRRPSSSGPTAASRSWSGRARTRRPSYAAAGSPSRASSGCETRRTKGWLLSSGPQTPPPRLSILLTRGLTQTPRPIRCSGLPGTRGDRTRGARLYFWASKISTPYAKATRGCGRYALPRRTTTRGGSRTCLRPTGCSTCQSCCRARGGLPNTSSSSARAPSSTAATVGTAPPRSLPCVSS